jgi:hypothetical protein
MVGVVKDNTDQDSWFSAKPITATLNTKKR